MTAARLGYIVTFDVSFDGYRRQVGKLLERRGPRIMHSVYDIDVTPSLISKIEDRIVGIVEPRDHILLLPYCGDCSSAWSGVPLDAPPPNGWIVTS
jgi:CRISPR-associated endonuclease Cas2